MIGKKGGGSKKPMRCEICKCKVPKDCTICMECWEREFEIVEREFVQRKPQIVGSWNRPVKAPVCRKRNRPELN
jgi:ribosomal protein S26